MIGLDCTEDSYSITMKRLLLIIPSLIFAVGMYMAILLGLVRITLYIREISGVVLQILAGCGELVLGTCLLLGGTFLVTRLAVWLFQPSVRITA
jgi:hypothetical protein